MPAFSAHYIFAKELADKLSADSGFKININAVYIGAQGPDIFFFHRVFPWLKGKALRSAGSAFHRAKFGDVLDIFRTYCKNSANPEIAKSYAYGFIMHYALDRNCHPFIYYLQNRITKKNSKLNPNSVHNTIEAALDSLLLNKHMDIDNPKAFDASYAFSCTETEKEEIAAMLSNASRIILPLDFTKEDVKTAIEDTEYTQHLLADKNGRRKAFIEKAEVLAFPFTKNFRISSFLRTDDLENAEKYVNIENRRWKSPFESGYRTESFYDLYAQSKKDALKMITAFENGLSGEEITHNLSFLTGVKVK